ncbi:sensor histidine kinase [Tropicimonas sp.]|uniref:sensor histidine kinase n=1 Tax=Tropicimonas sp. TaxID=2067044 RepID=UPI003A854A8C
MTIFRPSKRSTVSATATTRIEPVRHGRIPLGETGHGRAGKPPRARPEMLVALRSRGGALRRFTLNRSPLARRIIGFNLIGLLVLMGGVFCLNPFQDTIARQHVSAIRSEVMLIADLFEATMPAEAGDTGWHDPQRTLDAIHLSRGVDVFVFDTAGRRLAARSAAADPLLSQERSTLITDGLNAAWVALARVFSATIPEEATADGAALAGGLVGAAVAGETPTRIANDADGRTLFSVATAVRDGARTIGVVAMSSAAGEIDLLVRNEREQILQMFVVAILVSIGLSLLLASTIANPLSDLATAAETGRDNHSPTIRPGRVRIPDLTGRPDEIGRLSGSLRGMVAALYDRIDANEQFAADVAHEIKNPLASLRSAVGAMRLSRRSDQREKLLDVIDHDVRRLDRLVSDISNASRLDSELVKEDEERFDLVRTLANLTGYFGAQAEEKEIVFVTDLPDTAIEIVGLEARLAQVFVNLITNAISFCEGGDAVRVWVRRRANRVLVVVEDTGPGIPEQALARIFQRFYSERPAGQFGDHSGLGLAISRQIVEAHGGVIWAENVRPTEIDLASEPLGARFVVGLPV